MKSLNEILMKEKCIFVVGIFCMYKIFRALNNLLVFVILTSIETVD